MTWSADVGAIRIHSGPGALSLLGTLARELGGSRVFVVTDRGVRSAGHVDSALACLDGLSAEVFDDVAENPTSLHVEEGRRFASEFSPDLLVGLGGGSAMDCAKGINFLLTNGGRMEDYRGTGKASKPMLPSIGVPTTAGTGSEAQSYALISHPETHEKMACGDRKARFRDVILDPRLAASAPRKVAATAGIDAVSHAVESHVTSRGNAVSRMLSREAWRLLSSSLEAALGSDDLDAVENTLLGAHFAGAAIEASMLGAAHACANPLTARFGIVHGVAVGLMLPHVVRFNGEERYLELQSEMASRIEELRAAAGLPERLRDCGVDSESLPLLAEEASRQWTATFNPRPVDAAALLSLYEAAF